MRVAILKYSNSMFRLLKNVLDSCMKHLWEEGVRVDKNQAETIIEEGEDILWTKGLLREHSLVVLCDTMVWLCGMFLALRDGAELRGLKRNQSN